MCLRGRSREGAWIEIPPSCAFIIAWNGRSREGAWIEIDLRQHHFSGWTVAPVRERGLKSFTFVNTKNDVSRSREGAWIEIK